MKNLHHGDSLAVAACPAENREAAAGPHVARGTLGRVVVSPAIIANKTGSTFV
jgi:hypothetical protein